MFTSLIVNFDSCALSYRRCGRAHYALIRKTVPNQGMRSWTKSTEYQLQHLSPAGEGNLEKISRIRLRYCCCLFQKLGGLSYFAGAEKKDDRVLVPDLGSLTSVHDR
jgi:hypothetical protein